MINYFVKDKILLDIFSKEKKHYFMLNNIENIDISYFIKQIINILFKDLKIKNLDFSSGIFYFSDNFFIKTINIYNITEQLKMKNTGLVIINNIKIENDEINILKTFLLSIKPKIFLIFIKNINNNFLLNKSFTSLLYIFDIYLTFNQKISYLIWKYNITYKSAILALKISRNNLPIIIKIKNDKKIWELRLYLINIIYKRKIVLQLKYNVEIFYIEYLYWLYMLLTDILYKKMNIINISYQDFVDKVDNISKRFTYNNILKFSRKISYLNNLINKNINVNKDIAIQSIINNLSSV